MKLFNSILDSTIWDEPWAVKGVWITMLAMANRQGKVEASITGLARRATVTVEEAERALEKFLAPDKHSKTPDFEGRRIEVIDGGWHILNYQKYRDQRDEDARKEYQRQWDRDHRGKDKKSGGTDGVRHLPTNSDTVRPIADADADAESTSPLPPKGGGMGSDAAVNGKPHGRRRTRDQVMEPYPGGVRNVANVVLAKGFWPRQDPDGRQIVPDPSRLCLNLDRIFRAHPGLEPDVLIRAAKAYLEKPRKAYCAPQWFFGAGTDREPAHWEAEVRMLQHLAIRKAEQAHAAAEVSA